MQQLNRQDSSIDQPIYNNAKVAELYHNGTLSRPEAEVLDILYAQFPQSHEEDDTEPRFKSGDEESYDASCVAIIHEGAVIPIISLEEVILRSISPATKRNVCKQAANILYDILLTLLDQEGGQPA